jgi:hypothetical protein
VIYRWVLRELDASLVGVYLNLDPISNSVRAMKAIDCISDQLGVNVFGSGR